LQTEPPLPPPLAAPSNGGAGMPPSLTPTPGVPPQEAVLVLHMAQWPAMPVWDTLMMMVF
jgi:hypothetical protein